MDQKTRGVFIIQNDGELVELEHVAPELEDRLQYWLAEYCQSLLPTGDELGGQPSQQWLLVDREVPIPHGEDEPGDWFVDHLFLDQAGVPTLVEVKLEKNADVRRKVVGQLLDYAAHARSGWTASGIRAILEGRGVDASDAVRALIGSDGDIESFWDSVAANLKSGRVRLLFVADHVPSELREVVAFLNEQMSPAEVLAVEFAHYRAKGGLRMLVPRVFGRVEPPVPAPSPWDEARFMSALAGAPQEAAAAKKILEWASGRQLGIRWGNGLKNGSFGIQIPIGGIDQCPVAIYTGYTGAYVEFRFRQMTRWGTPLDDASWRATWRAKLEAIPGLKWRGQPDVTPSFQLGILGSDAALGKFSEAMDWAVKEIQAANVAG